MGIELDDGIKDSSGIAYTTLFYEAQGGDSCLYSYQPPGDELLIMIET